MLAGIMTAKYLDRMKYVRQEILRRSELKHITGLNMVDGLLFYKKDLQYTSGVQEQVLWIKPYMLPDLFEGISVPKRLMTQKPDTYTNFESFVDDVNNGRVKNKKNKKKSKSKKDFVPNVKLVLPPNEECNKGGDNCSGKQKKTEE